MKWCVIVRFVAAGRFAHALRHSSQSPMDDHMVSVLHESLVALLWQRPPDLSKILLLELIGWDIDLWAELDHEAEDWTEDGEVCQWYLQRKWSHGYQISSKYRIDIVISLAYDSKYILWIDFNYIKARPLLKT